MGLQPMGTSWSKPTASRQRRLSTRHLEEPRIMPAIQPSLRDGCPPCELLTRRMISERRGVCLGPCATRSPRSPSPRPSPQRRGRTIGCAATSRGLEAFRTTGGEIPSPQGRGQGEGEMNSRRFHGLSMSVEEAWTFRPLAKATQLPPLYRYAVMTPLAP